MSNLKQQLIRLGNKEPSLRKHLRPILDNVEIHDKTSSVYALTAEDVKTYFEQSWGGRSHAKGFVNWAFEHAYPVQLSMINQIIKSLRERDYEGEARQIATGTGLQNWLDTTNFGPVTGREEASVDYLRKYRSELLDALREKKSQLK